MYVDIYTGLMQQHHITYMTLPVHLDLQFVLTWKRGTLKRNIYFGFETVWPVGEWKEVI